MRTQADEKVPATEPAREASHAGGQPRSATNASPNRSHIPSGAIATPIAHLAGPGKIKVVNTQLAFCSPGAPTLRFDLRHLRAVYCYGPVTVSDKALHQLLRHGVQVALLSGHGHRCYGRLVAADDSAAALRRRQLLGLQQPATRLKLARLLVLGKLDSRRSAARHYQRQGHRQAGHTLARLDQLRARCEQAGSLDALRGLEGAATAAWFDLYGKLFRPPWQFQTRNKRPPTDPVNALLSLGYTWLANRASTELAAHGLELSWGALHADRPGRPSLACDMIEPLRTPAVDRWVLCVCNQGVIAPNQFQPDRRGGLRLQQGLFPDILASWERWWTQRRLGDKLRTWIRQWLSRLPKGV